MGEYSSNGPLDARWYRPEYATSRHDRISAVVSRIWKAQQYRRDLALRHARLYGNLPILGLGPRSYARKAAMANGGRLAFNVIKSCADTYTAKMVKDRPKVTFVTSGGDYGLQRKAKLLDSFIEGQFYESDLYETSPRVVLDTAVFGTGFVKVYIDETDEDEPRIAVDRVLHWEVLTDDAEAVYGEPRSIYQRKWVDRRVLMAMYPECSREILSCPREETEGDDYGFDSTADQVLVTEAWHLKSGKDADDGVHAIVIANATLDEEEWVWSWLPIRPLRRQMPLVGYHGTGVAEELSGIQLELNVLVEKIRRSHHLLASGHWLVQKGTTNKQKLDNDIGSIIEYTGVPPQMVMGMAVTPDVYQHLDRLYGKAFELSGISQSAAQSLKPAGLNSGEALRVYSDISTERFQVNFREFQHWHLDIAKRVLDLAGELSKRHPKFAVKAVGKSSLATVIFKDAFLKANEYVLKLYPTNALANDPASKIEQVKAFADAGWVDAAEAKRLLDFPDLQSVANYDNASYDLTQDIIEKLKEGVFVGPDPLMNLQDSIKQVQLAALRHKHDTLDDSDRDGTEKVLQGFRDWLVQAQDILTPPAQSPDMQAPPGEGPPPPENAGAPPGGPPNQAPPMAA